MSLHTGLSTWFVRSSSASGIQLEHLQTARASGQFSDELQRYLQQRRVEWRTTLVTVSLAGIVILICLAAIFRA